MRPPPGPELVIDLCLPARYPSRYRGKLLAASRLEARVRFGFEPSVFRSGDIERCGVELLLIVGKESLRLCGELRPDCGSLTARIRFGEPIGLPDYSFLRKACGLEEGLEEGAEDEAVSASADAAPPAEEPTVSVGRS